MALIAAGVRRVFIAVADPNPLASGGTTALREAGVEVEVGLRAEEAEAVNWQFLGAMRRRRAMVTVKAGISLDGRIALPSGESQWITGEAARRAGRRLRAQCGAVLVGRRTIEADDPELTVRLRGVPNPPVRVVLDPRRDRGGTYRVFDNQAPTRVLDETAIGPAPFSALRIARHLFENGINGVLVEGGAQTVAAFLREGVVDRLELFLAPKVLGGGPAWTTGIGISRLDEAPSFTLRSVRRWGPDLQLSYAPPK
jgi:diaminohydroxyphosphoribosylaminopyrimidine deaminase/5-amino-6-(5-phosphoribosylamino)uracil reductase